MTESTKAWSERTAFAGWDWARDHHDVVVVDGRGTVVEDFRIDETAEGWHRLKQRLSKYPDPAIAIETSSGAAVERLLEAGYAVFPVNPKAARRYRERKAPSGTKTDRLDAWSLADALRLDGHTWRVLRPDDLLTVELRLLCRDEIALTEQRTALVCQLRAALHEYYPTALRAFDDWTARASCGPLWSDSPPPRPWWAPGSGSGGSYCTPTSSITPKRCTPSGWSYGPARRRTLPSLPMDSSRAGPGTGPRARTLPSVLDRVSGEARPTAEEVRGVGHLTSYHWPKRRNGRLSGSRSAGPGVSSTGE
ncbi:MAG: IS110 family transposase [Planctomycetota bacterium]